MNNPIRILVVDDHPLLREGVCSTLESVQEFEVIGQGASFDEAVAMAQDLLPEIVLMDVSMPGGGVNAARTIHEKHPQIKISMLTVCEDESDVMSALQAGAKGYILKGVGGKELIKTVRKVSTGESYITPSLATSILLQKQSQHADKQTGPLDKLNPRETTILKAVGRGLTNRQIADELFLSEKTIKHYMTSILQKLEVRNRVEAALIIQKIEGTSES